MDPKNINTNPLGQVDPTAAPVDDPINPQIPVEPTVVDPGVANPIVSEEPTAPETPVVDPMAVTVVPEVSPMAQAPIAPTVDLGVTTPDLTGTPTVEEPVANPVGVADEPIKTQI